MFVLKDFYGFMCEYIMTLCAHAPPSYGHVDKVPSCGRSQQKGERAVN